MIAMLDRYHDQIEKEVEKLELMVLTIAVLLVVGAHRFHTIRSQPGCSRACPRSPTAHLEERKSQIYENLRDLQFEYRLGKLSDADYQKTKVDLQRELAKVLAEIDTVSRRAASRRQAGSSKSRCAAGHRSRTRTAQR